MANKTDMEKQFSELQEQMSYPPDELQTRNINHDVHQGSARQRPYSQIESQMGRMNVRGFRTMDELKAALPEGDELVERDGDYFRKVPYHIGPDGTYMKDGKLIIETHWALRPVALTKEGAKASTEAGVEADWFDGFTWWRRGVKPEKDMSVAAHQAAQPFDVTYEDASPASAAAYQQLAVHQQAVKPVAPVKEKD